MFAINATSFGCRLTLSAVMKADDVKLPGAFVSSSLEAFGTRVDENTMTSAGAVFMTLLIP